MSYVKAGTSQDVTLLSAGPRGETVRSDDKSVISCGAPKPASTHIEDGRIWVLNQAASRTDVPQGRRTSQSVTRIAVGPWA